MMTSTKKSPKLDKKIKEILKKKEAGQYQEALMDAENLSTEYPDVASVFGLAASMYFEADQFDKAAEKYKKATEISPKSEAASLGLFHSLWQMDKNDQAFDEMKRYMSIAQSDEYNELLTNFSKK